MHMKFDMAFFYFHGDVFVEVELVVQYSSQVFDIGAHLYDIISNS